MKKILSLALVLLICFSVMPFNALADEALVEEAEEIEEVAEDPIIEEDVPVVDDLAVEDETILEEEMVEDAVLPIEDEVIVSDADIEEEAAVEEAEIDPEMTETIVEEADTAAVAEDVVDTELEDDIDIEPNEEEVEEAAADDRFWLDADPVVINPMYESILSDAEIAALVEQASSDEYGIATVSEAEPSVYYTTYEEVAQSVREQMKARDEYVCIAIRMSQSAYHANEGFANDIFDLAFEHTGDPLEGDSLLWCWYLRTQIPSLTTCIEDGNDYLFALYYEMTYYDDAEQEAALATKLDEVMASLNLDGMTDYEKVFTIHQYICDNIVYDNAHKSNSSYLLKYSAYAALCQGTAVCLGYATLFYRMALMCGIDCRVIEGYSNENHAWNIVKLGTYYYNLDTTWDAGYTPETYRYFLTSTAGFTNHERFEDYDTPEFNAAYPMGPTNYSVATCTHDFEAVVTVEPTCTTEGTVTYMCKACGTISSTETIPVVDHNYVGRVCSVCGNVDLSRQFTASAVSGNNSTYDKAAGGSLTFVSNDNYTYYKRVLVDGTVVSSATVQGSSDSIQVTLPSSYLTGLDKGDHTLVIEAVYVSGTNSLTSQVSFDFSVIDSSTHTGDLNGDGKIDGVDLLAVQEILSGIDRDVDVDAADLNGDGKVDGVDLLALSLMLAME